MDQQNLPTIRVGVRGNFHRIDRETVEAEITKVWNPGCVNLITDAGLAPTSVPVVEAREGAVRPTSYYFVPFPEVVQIQQAAKPAKIMLVGDLGIYYGPKGAEPVKAEVTHVWSDEYVDIKHEGGGSTSSVLVKHTGPGPDRSAFVFVPDRKPTASTKPTIDAELTAKGKTAPSIVLADIEAAIASEYYFTAADGVSPAIGVVSGYKYPGTLDLITICVLVLVNGHRMVGVNTGPVSAANFDPNIGRKMARDHAIEQMWPLMGFLLKDKLHELALKDASVTDWSAA